VGDVDLKVISTFENSNKFQKTKFWKEKSVEDVVTLRPTTHATLVVIDTCWSHLVHKFCASFIIIDFAIHVTNSMMF